MRRICAPSNHSKTGRHIVDTLRTIANVDHSRRRFLGAAGVTAVASQLGMLSSANAQPVTTKLPEIKPGTNVSFGPLKQIDAGVLNVGYVEAGPIDGPAVILLHGWPYDIHSFVEVTPRLASAGFRVIVPYARGYGTTRFLSSETPRTGQPSALAVDTIALMDALNIKQADHRRLRLGRAHRRYCRRTLA